VNGDGYGDVVVGAQQYDHGSVNEGRAYLYQGSATGLDMSATWRAESNNFAGYFGGSVSGAGDVNGDGYGDVAVGASSYTNGEISEGRAYVYLGSAFGLEATAAWTEESNQANAAFGAVSTAGDVDADGYDDIIVGASQYRFAPGILGGAFLYLGGGIIDFDVDGVADEVDLCPHVADPEQEDLDGDGVGDACVPLTLTVNQVSVLGGLSVDVDTALPGETVSVFLANGPPEMGPCPRNRAHLCLDVGERTHYQRWDVVADADGRASLVGVALPASAVESSPVTIQAAAGRGEGGVKSDAIETTIGP
jgi:hypothetical protein